MTVQQRDQQRLRSMPMRLLLIFCLAAPAAQAELPIDVTILCDESYPPYSYVEKGKAQGLYSDIVRAAFRRMPRYRVSIRPVPWARGLAELAKGSAFALYPPYHRPLERPWMDYSQPIAQEQLAAFVRLEVANKRSIEDFPTAYSGLRIGLNRGFSSVVDPRYNRMLLEGKLRQSVAKDNRTNLLQLRRGRIDVFINDRLSIIWELSQMIDAGLLSQDLGSWLVEGPTLSSEWGHLGYTRLKPQNYPYKQDFMRQFDLALSEMKQDGSLAAITLRYAETIPALPQSKAHNDASPL